MGILKRRFNLFIAATCIVYLFCGCSKSPDKKLATAQAALKAAKEVEADVYMSKNYQNLETALKTAEADIAKENSKFIINRKYKKITLMLDNIIELATEITKEAPKIKSETISQVEQNLELLDGMLEETANDIKKASRGKDKAVIEELKADLNTADSIGVIAAEVYKKGDVFGASEHLAEIQGLIKKITDTLNPPKTDS